MSKPILYSYFRSSASWRVRIALSLKGIAYDTKPVSLIKDGGQQHSDEYKRVNPMEQVPALMIDGVLMTQSLPIIEYLEETRPGQTRLLPADPVQRQAVRTISELINSGIQPIQNLTVLQHVVKLSGNDATKMEWGQFYINKGFKAVETILEKTAGKYCVGDEVSMADLCLVPQVYNGVRRLMVAMTQFSTLMGIHDNLMNLEAFRASHPSQEPDCPEQFKNETFEIR